MNEYKFSVGDKVKDINKHSDYFGEVGEITNIDNDEIPYKVVFEDRYFEFYSENNLELATDYKFNIGDKVKIIHQNVYARYGLLHEKDLKGEIIEILKGTPLDFKLELKSGETLNVYEDEIELTTDYKYNHGDEVIVKFDGSYAEGVISQLEPSGIWVKIGDEKFRFTEKEIQLKSELENEKDDKEDNEHTTIFQIGDTVIHKDTTMEGEITDITDDRLTVKIDSMEIVDDESEFEKRTLFPDDFQDWSSGVNISDDRINKWIEEIKEGEYTSVSSGNTVVIKQNNTIYVAKNYWKIEL